MDLVGRIFAFIYKFSMTLGGGVCIAWFAGALVAYCSLARPVWEVAIVVGANLFAFTRVCYWIFRKKRSGGSEGELPEETGKDEAPLTEDLDDYEVEPPAKLADVPLFLRWFLYLTIPLVLISVALIPLLIVLGMIVQTWEFWAAWTTGSEWMRSPGTMIAVASGFMILACLGVFSIRFGTDPDASFVESGEEESKEETRRDAGESLPGDTLAENHDSPPPPPNAPA